jgi:glyoxylase-like metal-dependent hydrolase (beta-lactamase superfamily II)
MLGKPARMKEVCQLKHLFEEVAMPITSVSSGKVEQVAEGVYALCVQIVNVCYLDAANGWVLVDCGMTAGEAMIMEQAAKLYGADRPPQAIIVTHGHFDHIGSLPALLNTWDVPVYAHELELPYLRGETAYPPGDPTVDGGLVSELSPLFPHDGLHLGDRVQPLTADSLAKLLPGWQSVHTPGHTPGHLSLFRESDRTLVAGDAFVAVKQESLYRVFSQKAEISGPPRYMTTDWASAEDSVAKLANMEPAAVITGHGHAMRGDAMLASLKRLAENFRALAVPERGRFV